MEELDTGAKSDSGKAVKDGGNNGTTGAISPRKAKRNDKSGVEKKAYGSPKECMAKENGISAVIHTNRQRPICVILCRLTKQRNLSADVIGDKKKMRRTQEIS